MQIAKGDSDQILKLSGALRINVADELRAALLDFVCTASRPVVDLSEVTECDSAGIQLLVSASRTAERSAKRLKLARVSAELHEAAAALGLSLPEALTDSLQCMPQDVAGAAGRGSNDAT